MALIDPSALAAPATASSILIIGPSGTGKSACIATLHRYLRLHNLPTRIAYFDFDGDGIEPVARLAREGYESMEDKIANTNRVKPWLDDLIGYRYIANRRQMKDGPLGIKPHRDSGLALEFIKDFNTLDSRLDPETKKWLPGQELGALVFDPLTSVQAMYEDFIWTTRNKEMGDTGTSAVSWVDWGLLGEKVRDVYMLGKQFPCFFIAMAHLDQRLEEVRTPENAPKQNTGQWFYTVALVKGLAMTIQKDFSLTLFSTVDGPKHEWITQAGPHYRGVRSRGRDGLPPRTKQDFREVLDV